MKYAILAMILFSACSMPPKTERLDIVLRNTGKEEVVLKASAGILSRTIRLAPGKAWRGWVPTGWMPDKIAITIAEHHTGGRRK